MDCNDVRPTGVVVPTMQGDLQLQLLSGQRGPLRHRSPGLLGQVPRLRQRARLPEKVSFKTPPSFQYVDGFLTLYRFLQLEKGNGRGEERLKKLLLRSSCPA